jgi:hypothetical protein
MAALPEQPFSSAVVKLKTPWQTSMKLLNENIGSTFPPCGSERELKKAKEQSHNALFVHSIILTGMERGLHDPQ